MTADSLAAAIRKAGYDVAKGPGLWQRFARKYGGGNKVVNFFFSDHSMSETRARNLSPAGFAAALAEIASWPDYAPTPLETLPGLAGKLGLAAIHYKDEGPRFGLGSFKALGGAYGVARVLSRELARRGIANGVTSADLISGRHAAAVAGITVTSATDGNHGRAVACLDALARLCTRLDASARPEAPRGLAPVAQVARCLGVHANGAKASFNGVSARWLA